MTKMKLDQQKPAKANMKTMAQRKKAKMLKEKAALEELRKEFPKLFSPARVENIERRNKLLVQSSLKNDVCPEEIVPAAIKAKERTSTIHQRDNIENCENMTENTINSERASTTRTDTLKKKGSVQTPQGASSSSRVLQVLGSPALRPTVSSRDQSRAQLPACSCRRRQSQTTDDVENHQCDICKQIAPLASTRQDVVHALRNFLHKPTSPPVHRTEADTASDKFIEATVNTNECDLEEISLEDVVVSAVDVDTKNIPTCQSPLNEKVVMTNLFDDINMEMPETSSGEGTDINTAVLSAGQTFEEETLDSDQLATNPDTSPLASDCFNETLMASLASGRVRGRVVGRKVLSEHVEFIFKLQVLKEGYTFDEITDQEYFEDCLSPSSHAISRGRKSPKVSPYSIQMCILRRYSDFEKLLEKLVLESKKVNVDSKHLTALFPEKQYFRFFGKRWADPSFLQSREEGLSRWLGESVIPAMSGVTNSPKRNELKSTFVKAVHEFMSL